MTAVNNLSKNDNALYANIRKGQAKFVVTIFWLNFNNSSINKETKENDLTVSDTASATINIK